MAYKNDVFIETDREMADLIGSKSTKIPMFKDLDDEEEKDFRDWATKNYIPGTEIKTIWHPVIQDEC